VGRGGGENILMLGWKKNTFIYVAESEKGVWVSACDLNSNFPRKRPRKMEIYAHKLDHILTP
jgi:hypothetical protein